MWPSFAHQKPGRALVVLVEPESDAGSGWGGEWESMYAQAAVPGSSEPSGQSQVLSFTRDFEIEMAGCPMQVNLSFNS